MINDIVTADKIIGKTVLSKVSGNKLGEVEDLYIDPIEGLLKGITIKNSEGRFGGLDFNNIYSFGKDAVMAVADEKIVPLEEKWVKNHSHAKQHLMGINVVTESGNLIGKIADIYVRLSAPPIVIYEIGETIIDRWLGRNFFIPASAGTALSSNAERIVVSNEAANSAAPTLKELFSAGKAPNNFAKNSQKSPALGSFDEKETVLRPRNSS